MADVPPTSSKRPLKDPMQVVSPGHPTESSNHKDRIACPEEVVVAPCQRSR